MITFHSAARLTVQTPPAPGSANLPHPLAISTGICRLALRNDLLVPLLNEAAEQPVAVDFELQPLAYRIPAGSWLRLEISTGETPRYLPRLLTSDRSGISRKVENSVWHTPRYPSRIILPVLNKAPPA